MGGNNPTIVKAYPVSMIKSDIRGYSQNDSDSRIEPYVGLEFNTPDDAREFYGLYAMRVGFRVRTGQLYRSRTDGSVASRRFVCSKEGFQLNSRTGCPAFIRVQRRDSGKWVIDQIHKDHNHELGISVENDQVDLDGRIRVPTAVKSECEASQRKKIKFLKEGGGGGSGGVGILIPSGLVNAKRFKRGGDGGVIVEPYSGLVFNSADDAYHFYQAYAEGVGFRVRIGQLFRSKNDGLITSRRFVCSKEGFQHPSRLGCGAFMRIKKQDGGTWIVDRLQQDHNHDFDHQIETPKKSSVASKKLMEEVNGGLECLDFTQANHGGLAKKNQVDINWYPFILDYFQSRQAQDTGFFYAVEVSDGSCMSVFWADGRSRFLCCQFGDAITFDTSYRRSNYTLPFGTFVGVNQHKQPVLLGCALIANESKESFTWLFQTWQRAMSGCRPKSIIADQDLTLQQAISQVFPGTHHRFSTWQIRAKEQEFLRSMTDEFRYDYEKCVYQCQTSAEFNSMWNALINKYGLKDNMWLKYMYEKRESWVPLYLRGTFFAGIPINESVEPFFGPYLNEQILPKEFVPRYEQELELRRVEEKKEDYNSSNLQAFLQTKEPVEEQCRRIYTLTVFRIFQNELLQSYNYLAMKSYEEGSISRYSVRRCGNESEKHAVTFSASNYTVGCSCQMFEFEGVLCKHILRVFNLLDIREIPSRYLLHRWTRNAEFGTVYNIESVVNSQELRSLMVWSLREASSKYIESGTSSFEKYKVAYEILREGERKLSWHR